MLKFLRLILRSPDDGQGGGGAGAGDGGAGAGAGAGAGTGDGGQGGAGDETPSWLDVFPDEVAKDPNFNKYKTPDEFVKGYKSTVELVGRKGIIVPTEKSTPEEREKFLNDLGRPEKPDGYKFTATPDNLHPSVKVGITPEFDKGLQALFHKHGVRNGEEANGLRGEFINMLNQSAIETEKRETVAMQNAQTSLRSEWKENYDANIKNLTAIVMKNGGQEAVDAMGGEQGLGNNPIFLKTFNKIVGMIGEDRLKSSNSANGSSNQGNETVEEAKAKIAEIQKQIADPKSPINDLNNADRKNLLAERTRLYQIAYPNEG